MTVAQSYEHFVATDGDELWRRIDDAQDRFFRLVRSIGPGVVGAGTTWTSRDTVAHILNVAERYTNRDITSTDGLGDSPRAVDEINARELRTLDGIEMDELLPRLEAQMKLVRAAFAPDQLDLNVRFPFHGGTTIDAAGGLSNIVGEFLLHGYDLARASGQPWPIAGRDGLLILNGIVQLLTAYAEPAARGTLDLVLRLPGAKDWLFAFDNGDAISRAADSGTRPDVVLKAPADTMLLMLYQRLGPAASIRAGLRVAGGRRPWRVAKLQSFLQQP